MKYLLRKNSCITTEESGIDSLIELCADKNVVIRTPNEYVQCTYSIPYVKRTSDTVIIQTFDKPSFAFIMLMLHNHVKLTIKDINERQHTIDVDTIVKGVNITHNDVIQISLMDDIVINLRISERVVAVEKPIEQYNLSDILFWSAIIVICILGVLLL